MTERQAKLAALQLLRPRDVWRPEVLHYQYSQHPCLIIIGGTRQHYAGTLCWIYGQSDAEVLDEFDERIRENKI